jgi:type VI secretion system secreted protein VgrG
MALQTTTSIQVGGSKITNFHRLQINQEIHDHHTFTLELIQEQLVEEGESAMAAAKKLISEQISIEIKTIPDLDDILASKNPSDYTMRFVGVVTNLSMQKSQNRDMEEIIVLQGYSLSVLLDNGPESQSYTKLPISDIVNKVKSDYSEVPFEVKSNFTKPLAYTVQYNESDFDFLNRMAMRYGQWFYYSGQKMIFGDPGSGNSNPKLEYGINLQNFNYSIKLNPTVFKTLENDNQTGKHYLSSTAKYESEALGFHKDFVNKSKQLFKKETILQLNQNAVGGDGEQALEQYSKSKLRASVGDMMRIDATSEVPGVTLGNRVEISGVDKQLEGTYRVIQVTHTCDDSGGYENHFSAVHNTMGSVFSPRTNPDLTPFCESQPAEIVDNNDPEGLGRIKVKMPWQEPKGETTPWIPMVQPHGGGGKGFHFVPEIGEKVFVDFQAGNAEMPIVVGTLHSKAAKSGHHVQGNHVKAIQTRSGNKLVLDDNAGSVNLADKGGANMAFDGAGNAVTNAAVTKTINVGGKKGSPPQSLLKMDNEGNITLDGKTTITFRVGDNSIVISKEGITGSVAEGNISFDATAGTFNIKSSGAMDVTTDDALTIKGGPSAVMSSGDTNIM